MFHLERFSTALRPATLVGAVLALVLVAGGVGYATGKVGTKDLKDGAVTSKKVRDGSLRVKDLRPEQGFTYVGDPGGPVLRDGGEGDCVWSDARDLADGLTPIGFRIDRFGTVHLSGTAQALAVPSSGDGLCGGTQDEVSEDGIALLLPRPYWPAATLLIGLADGVVITGPQGLSITGGLDLPPGAVYCSSVCALEGVSYLPVGSKLVRPTSRTGRARPGAAARLLDRLGLL
jgi:hypothetical protein